MITFEPDTQAKAEDVNANFTELDDRLLAIETVEAWIAPIFQNSWVNYSAGYDVAGYYKDPLGVVHIKGLIKSGTVGTSSPSFTLPTGYRPENTKIFVTLANNVLARLDVKANGEVTMHTGSNAYWSLEGITFRAYQ